MSDPTDAGYREILALRRRLARIEAMAEAAAQAPPTEPAPGFGDALATLRREGSARGPAIDALRAAVEGPRPATPAPDPARLAEATARLTADLRGAPTIETAYADMQSRAARLDTIETADPGGSGRLDPSAPTASKAADRIRRALTERH